VGNIVQAMMAYARGELGPQGIELAKCERLIVIGSDRMMAAVKAARHEILKPYLEARAHRDREHQLADAVHDEGDLRAVPAAPRRPGDRQGQHGLHLLQPGPDRAYAATARWTDAGDGVCRDWRLWADDLGVGDSRRKPLGEGRSGGLRRRVDAVRELSVVHV
jgi:hypothetical protein